MRKIQSIPGHREFYNEHGRSLTAYKTIANIGQLLSAASLALAIFSLLADAIAGRGFTTHTGVIIALAVLIGVFIELANRMLARPAIRPLVVKDQFADSADQQQRHRTITRWSRAGLFAVGGLSLVLSYMGSMDAGKLITTDVAAINTDSLNNAATEAIAAVNATFEADTAVLLAPYAQRQQAALNQFQAIKAERTKAAEQYRVCANKGNQWCKNNRQAIFGAIDNAEAEYSATVAAIATERGATLAAAIRDRKEAIAEATGKTDVTAAELKAAYLVATGEAEAEAAANGYIFAVLTFAGQIVFYLMMYLVYQIEAGSEIEEDLTPNEFSNLPTVVSDFKAVVAHRVERGARRLIAYIFGERERLDKPLPYVAIWGSEQATAEVRATKATGDIIAPELTEADPIATNHAPGFYRSADDPHRPAAGASFTAHETNTKSKPEPTGQEHNLADLKQRLALYKKRLGTHTQKAIVQKRNDGTVKDRTAEAIANNQKWVEHYTGLLKNYAK